MRKLLLIALFLLGLVYILAPAPQEIDEIPPVPDSLKSEEPGDTRQSTNIAAYFSDYWREDLIAFYTDQFQVLNYFGFYIPPIRLNHPPEEGFAYVRDQQRSTFLEQLVYPLRGSLFINGYEPISQKGKKFDVISMPIEIGDRVYNSKTTLRYYPAPVIVRTLVYIGIWVSLIALLLLIRDSRKKGYL